MYRHMCKHVYADNACLWTHERVCMAVVWWDEDSKVAVAVRPLQPDGLRHGCHAGMICMNVHMDIREDTCTDTCVDMCITKCTKICMDLHGQVHKHLYGHAYGHVYWHVYAHMHAQHGHVYGHVYGRKLEDPTSFVTAVMQVPRHCIDMCGHDEHKHTCSLDCPYARWGVCLHTPHV